MDTIPSEVFWLFKCLLQNDCFFDERIFLELLLNKFDKCSDEFCFEILGLTKKLSKSNINEVDATPAVATASKLASIPLASSDFNRHTPPL